jgi:hypothetical protein
LKNKVKVGNSENDRINSLDYEMRVGIQTGDLAMNVVDPMSAGKYGQKLLRWAEDHFSCSTLLPVAIYPIN